MMYLQCQSHAYAFTFKLTFYLKTFGQQLVSKKEFIFPQNFRDKHGDLRVTPPSGYSSISWVVPLPSSSDK